MAFADKILLNKVMRLLGVFHFRGSRLGNDLNISDLFLLNKVRFQNGRSVIVGPSYS